MSSNAGSKNDSWKIHLFWLCVLGLFYFFDRKDHHSMLKELISIREQSESAQSWAEELSEELTRFDYDDWRDVVPVVKEKAEGLAKETSSVALSLSELEVRLTTPDDDPGDYDPY